ncbi:DUF3828 domain-containing protein [Paraburkholderia adhaesiva]|uniref:DUF3828 domain-containing protein n=1 Tax=Paraburkholderia adhaesiva TaxID=2883244 RepID=UPI001F188719|nr:DUF3828 domain-containing protein [Paraburkholderia adhaesiva]
MLRTALVAVMAWMLFGVQPALAQDIDSAKHFLASLYSAYTYNGTPPAIDTTGKDAIASPSLLKLIAKNRQALKGEAGVLGTDPVCQCQDFDLKTSDIEVRMTGRRKAKATVTFSNFHNPDKVQLSLVWIDGRWRIDDIRGSKQSRSLREALKAEIADVSR